MFVIVPKPVVVNVMASSFTRRAGADTALRRFTGLIARFADEKEPFRSLVHPMWKTSYGDYDHLARFIPGMSSSRTVSRNGAEAVVEQKGSAGLGPFRRSFTVLLAVTEDLNQSISASGIGGDFRGFQSRYEIVPIGSRRARIVYQATLVPGMFVPPIVGLFAMRSVIGSQFDALLEEIRRRAEAV